MAAAKKKAGARLRPFKFIVTAVVVTDDGATLVDRPLEQVVLHGMAGLRDYTERFEADLAQLAEDAGDATTS